MVSSLFGLIFVPFKSSLVQYCAACAYCVAVFGLIRRFVTGDYRMGS